MPNFKKSKQIEKSSLILFGLVGVFFIFSFYVFAQVKSLNQQILDIDNATISARTSYFLQAREGFFVAEAISDLNNRDDFKKVLYQAPKIINTTQPVPIKARIWGRVSSVTFTLKDDDGNILGTLVLAGPGENPTKEPRINTRYLNALYNVEHEGNLIIQKQPQSKHGVLVVEENQSDDPLNRISQSSHTVQFGAE